LRLSSTKTQILVAPRNRYFLKFTFKPPILFCYLAGKKYIFDIQRTCREVYDNARRILYQAGDTQIPAPSSPSLSFPTGVTSCSDVSCKVHRRLLCLTVPGYIFTISLFVYRLRENNSVDCRKLFSVAFVWMMIFRQFSVLVGTPLLAPHAQSVAFSAQCAELQPIIRSQFFYLCRSLRKDSQ